MVLVVFVFGCVVVIVVAIEDGGVVIILFLLWGELADLRFHCDGVVDHGTKMFVELGEVSKKLVS